MTNEQILRRHAKSVVRADLNEFLLQHPTPIKSFKNGVQYKLSDSSTFWCADGHEGIEHTTWECPICSATADVKSKHEESESDLQSEIDGLQLEIDSLQSENERLESVVNALEYQIAELKAAVDGN